MAIFKVGQRVRITHDRDGHPTDKFTGTIEELNGKPSHCRPREGIHHWVNIDGYGRALVHQSDLAPLTDPKADAFIESLKRLVKEEPKAPRPVTAKDIVDATLKFLGDDLDKYRGGSQ